MRIPGAVGKANVTAGQVRPDLAKI